MVWMLVDKDITLKPLSSRRRISKIPFLESIRENSMNLIRNVCMVCGVLEVWVCTGGFGTFSNMLKNVAEPPESPHLA